MATWPSEPAENTGDLDSVVAALHDRSGPLPVIRSANTCERSARSNRRAGLGLAFVALLACGVLRLATAIPNDGDTPSGDSRAGVVFANAQTGTCLSWPPNSPDKPSFVQCRDDHMFEVARSVEMTNFGEPCQSAVRQYLGPRYDPNSRFTISVLWAGDTAGGHAENRRLLCGLELLGARGEPVPFKGQVAAQDQSRVWPAGTCLGIDANTRLSTDLPVDCADPHAVEVTATVNLADRFPGPPPSAEEQAPFLGEECTRLSEAYVAPSPLQTSGFRVEHGTVPYASWGAGSRQVNCGLVSPSEQGLNPVLGSVRHVPVGDQEMRPPQAPPPAPEPSAPASTSVAPQRTTTASPPSTSPSTTPSSATPSPSSAPSSASPTTTSPTTTSPTTTPPTTTSPTTTPPTTTSPPLGPAPGPVVEPSERQGAAPGVIELPGLAPITLPGAAPPPPEG